MTPALPGVPNFGPRWSLSNHDGPAQVKNKTKHKGADKMFKNFLMDETGAELAEYGVAVALLVAIALVVYQVLGQGISDANSDTAAAMQNPDPGVVP
jgi:Flp pilus assembly pilin Flp